MKRESCFHGNDSWRATKKLLAYRNLNYKQIRTGQDKVNSQEEIETFLDRSKSKV